MIRSEFVAHIEKKHPSHSKKKIEQSLQVIFEHMAATLENGGRIEIRGFGSFKLNTLKPRTCRNPRTGKKLVTKPKKVIRFRSAKELSERLNKQDSHKPIQK